jgi:hypothetical protein
MVVKFLKEFGSVSDKDDHQGCLRSSISQGCIQVLVVFFDPRSTTAIANALDSGLLSFETKEVVDDVNTVQACALEDQTVLKVTAVSEFAAYIDTDLHISSDRGRTDQEDLVRQCFSDPVDYEP